MSDARDMQVDLVRQRRERGHKCYVLYFGADGRKYWSGPHTRGVAERATAMADRDAHGFIIEAATGDNGE